MINETGSIAFESTLYGLTENDFNPMPQPVCFRYILACFNNLFGTALTRENMNADGRFEQLLNAESVQLASNFEQALADYEIDNLNPRFGAALYNNCQLIGHLKSLEAIINGAG